MLEMVLEVIDQLNSGEIEGISYARRAMIRTGLCSDTDGIGKISQVNSELQTIVNENMLCIEDSTERNKRLMICCLKGKI